MRRKNFSLTIILLLVFIISGCTNKEYDNFVNEFSTTYLVIAKSIDIKDSYNSVKQLQSSQNEKEINKMKRLLDDNKEKVPKSKQRQYDSLYNWYEGIEFLKSMYSKWDKMSKDEKHRVQVELLTIATRKEEIEKRLK